jgi:hypothetical protein
MSTERAWAGYVVASCGIDGSGKTTQLRCVEKMLRRGGEDVLCTRQPTDPYRQGGDRAGTVNISTMSAIVAAAAGCRVVKHGSRSASSACGTADVLEYLGVAVDLDGPRRPSTAVRRWKSWIDGSPYHATCIRGLPSREPDFPARLRCGVGAL